jgi:hypothetical protein
MDRMTDTVGETPSDGNDGDHSLHHTLIWSLAIGIIIVIAALLLAKPYSENLTELYFNNHASLPEYSMVNSTERFSFTINNLENKDMTYTYSISAELYNMDYSCTRPEVYLESRQESEYSGYLENYYSIPTRIMTTDKPELIIKDSEYMVFLKYKILTGEQMVFGLTDMNQKMKYAVIINHDTGNVYLDYEGRTEVRHMDVQNTGTHTLNISVTGKKIVISLDGQNASFNTPKDYTRGYVYLEETNAYAEVYSFHIFRNGTRQDVIVRFADYQSKNVVLDSKPAQDTVIVYSKFLSDNSELYSRMMERPVIEVDDSDRAKIYYYSNQPLNISGSDIRINFRADKLLFALPGAKIYYDAAKSVIDINQDGQLRTFQVLKSTRSQEILISIIGGNANVAFNGRKIANMTGIRTANVIPYIETYDDTASIREFSVKSNEKPLTYTLKVKEISAPQQTYSALYNEDVLNSIISSIDSTVDEMSPESIVELNTTHTNSTLTKDQLERITEFIENQKLTWVDYRILASYVDAGKNNTFSISMKDLNETMYSVSINSINGNVDILYMNDSGLQHKSVKAALHALTRVAVDIYNDTIMVIVNDRNIFSAQISKSTDGMLLMGYSDVDLVSASAENRDNGDVRIYKKQNYIDCSPHVIRNVQYLGNETIMDGQSKKFNGYVKFEDDFDVAKVTVKISYRQSKPGVRTVWDVLLGKEVHDEWLNDDQEIYFIVKEI